MYFCIYTGCKNSRYPRMDSAAEDLKNQANDLFKNKDYERALELYSKAIEVDGTSGKVFFSNCLSFHKITC